MRAIDERAIKAHADLRFRSEYDYALFEYYRSAKVIAFLERAGVAVRGRVLDAYPNHRIIMTFDVAETTTGHDRAALVDKFAAASSDVTGGSGRAKD